MSGLQFKPLQGRLPARLLQQQRRAVPLARLRHATCTIKCAAAAASSLPMEQPRAVPASKPNLLQQVVSWFDVGVASVDRNRQPVSTGRLLALVKDMVAKESKLTATACLFMVAAALFELAIPHFTSKCVFAITKGAAQPEFHHYIAMLGAMSFGYATCAAARGALFSVIQNRLARQLRYRLFGVLMREESSFHDTNEPGQLTSRLTSDCNAICRCIATNVNVALRNSLQVIGGVAILFRLSWELSLMCMAVFAAHWLVTLSYGSYSRYSQRVAQDMLADSTACAAEAFGAARIVRTFGTEQVEQNRYDGWLRKLHDIGMRQAAAWGLYVVMGITAQNGCLLLALLMGGAMASQGVVTPEQVTSFMFYVQLVTHASANVCDQYGAIMEAVGASERVLSHLDDKPAPQIAPGLIPDNAAVTGKVTFNGVRYRYPTRPEVLAVDNVDLMLAPGKLTALVGGSGSGKSTLVSLLQRLADPSEGSIKLDEWDLRQVDAAWYRSRLGVVAQEPRLFGMSVRDNITYGCSEPVSFEDVVGAAVAANAHEFISALPAGYDTLVTDKMLSGGQRQRIALARALVRRPALLLLDEATSALDSESEAAVQKALDDVMKSQVGRTTMLVIAHRLSTVRNADHIVVLDKGQVAEQGTHVELLAQRGIYYRLVKRQEQGLTVADRDLSPGTREPPATASFEEYESLVSAGSNSLLNASVSLSSVQDAQMPPGEPMVVHGASGSSSGRQPVSASHQQPPQEQQQQQQQQQPNGVLETVTTASLSAGQPSPLASEQQSAALGGVVVGVAAVALEEGELAHSNRLSSNGGSSRSSRWGTGRAVTDARSATPVGVLSKGSPIMQAAATVPAGGSSATAVAGIATPDRSPSPPRAASPLQHQQQQQHTVGALQSAAAQLSTPQAQGNGTHSNGDSSHGAADVVVFGSAVALQNAIVPMPKGMVSPNGSSSSGSGGSGGGGGVAASDPAQVATTVAASPRDATVE